jgi:hypothetical protein
MRFLTSCFFVITNCDKLVVGVVDTGSKLAAGATGTMAIPNFSMMLLTGKIAGGGFRSTIQTTRKLPAISYVYIEER